MIWTFLLADPAFAKTKVKPADPVPPPVVEPAPDPLGAIPVPAGEPSFAPALPVATKLPNGVSVWTVSNPALPLVSIEFATPSGSVLDPSGKEGTASLAATLMTRGAGKRDAEAFATEVERLGVELESWVDHTTAHVSLSCTKAVVAAALDLAADAILRPTFAKGDVSRERELALAELESNADEPAWLASRTSRSLWYGPTHPYGRPVSGTLASLAKVGSNDVKAWWKQAWHAGGATVTVSGALTPDEATSLLDARFSKWKAGKVAPLVVPPAPSHAEAPIHIVDRPGSAQTGFSVVFPGVAFGDPAGAPLRSGTIVLGGTFTSRLNRLLREVRGYTYGIRARLVEEQGTGMAVISSQIRTDVTAPALTDILAELTRIRSGIDDAEAKKARGAFRQDVVESMETRGGVASAYAEWHAAGRTPGSMAEELSGMMAVSSASVAPAMAAYDPKQAIFVLVGDKAAIEGPLREAGYANLVVVTPP